jgi:hypothetical protein
MLVISAYDYGLKRQYVLEFRSREYECIDRANLIRRQSPGTKRHNPINPQASSILILPHPRHKPPTQPLYTPLQGRQRAFRQHFAGRYAQQIRPERLEMAELAGWVELGR